MSPTSRPIEGRSGPTFSFCFFGIFVFLSFFLSVFLSCCPNFADVLPHCTVCILGSRIAPCPRIVGVFSESGLSPFIKVVR